MRLRKLFPFKKRGLNNYCVIINTICTCMYMYMYVLAKQRYTPRVVNAPCIGIGGTALYRIQEIIT